MNFLTFFNRLVDDGIQGARDSYENLDMSEQQRQKLTGSIAGFETCRQVRVSHVAQDLSDLLDASRIATHSARDEVMDNGDQPSSEQYWWYRCYEAEVEWVCNCVSAILHNEGMPTIIMPTARGVLKASEIVGLRTF
jgi:hypothetical protein